jgi:aspartate racemase
VKILGLLGGMSWESTQPYYARINQQVQARLGGGASAELLLWSANFAEIEALQHDGAWDALGQKLTRAAKGLAAAGAEHLVLCTNTMHCLAEQIEAGSGLPLLHIADPTGAALRARGYQRVGLLGTRFTMEQAFYRDYLTAHFGLTVLTPEAGEREQVHRIIYEELVRGVIRDESRRQLARAVASLALAGAEAVILGCTELGLLLKEGEGPVPLLDTTRLHADAAAALALSV